MLAIGLILTLGTVTPSRVVTLDEALAAAAHVAQIVQAHASTEVSRALAEQGRAPLLPQISGTASYSRQTGNYVPNAGTIPSGGLTSATSSFSTYNAFKFGVNVTQFLYDFGETWHHWQSTKVSVEAQHATEINTVDQVMLAVRVAFFNARGMKALVKVAAETLDNQKRHLDQTAGFVDLGRDPTIAMAQARTTYANARVALVNAENNYLIAKAQLNLVIGMERSTDYEVADDGMAPVEGEDGESDSLAEEGKKARPDVLSLKKQVQAQALQLKSSWEGFAPALSAQMNLTDAGADITNMAWNWNIQFNLNVPVFNGMLTWAIIKQQKALLILVESQLEQQKQQVRLDVEQARLAVRAAKENIEATNEAVVNAQEQYRLAQERYSVGVGNMIEFGDAQVALTTAQQQKVQADFNLAIARAQLIKALGRR